ncbi:MAG: ATP-binding protein [Pseudomonadota bacterium]
MSQQESLTTSPQEWQEGAGTGKNPHAEAMHVTDDLVERGEFELVVRRAINGILSVMPRGLYARALIIIITPVVILQSIVAFVFMERHWEQVTQRLSRAVTQDIAAVIDVIETYPHSADYSAITRIARDRLGLTISVQPPEPLPAPASKPFFSVLDSALSQEISQQIGRPFWIDTVGNTALVEVRIQLEDAVLRVFARRSHTYASNSHIFLVWMVGSSLVLLAIAIVFLRNQITPILRLSREMDAFGRGRSVSPEFRPRGAREVRQATRQFLVMSDRLERQIEQRTTMLAGVSHDLRTVLTRFKLQLALLSATNDVSDLEEDISQMQSMLQGYLDFVSGHGDEPHEAVDVAAMLDSYHRGAGLKGRVLQVICSDDLEAELRPNGFQRMMNNVVSNALRHGETVRISAVRANRKLEIIVEDDGPGIAEDQRDNVFRPFYRLDQSRNIDESGTGLGLAIARDIAFAHGGDITLDDSEMGGLRVHIIIPL